MKSIVAVFVTFALVTYTSSHLICSSDEEFLERGPAYAPTCREFNPVSKITKELTFSGCFCASGRVRQESTGICVDKARCKCKLNEYRDSRGNCALKINFRDGLIINNLFGQDKKIGLHEFWESKCPLGYKKDIYGKCVLIVCPRGTVRDASGRCVINIPIDISVRVPKKTCVDGEIYRDCGPVQEPTCAEPRLSASVTGSGCIAGCFCKTGFLRKDWNSKCVTASECS